MTRLLNGLCYLLLAIYLLCFAFMVSQLLFFNAHDSGNLPLGAPPILYTVKSYLCGVCATSVMVLALLIIASLWHVHQQRPIRKALLISILCFYPLFYFLIGTYICW